MNIGFIEMLTLHEVIVYLVYVIFFKRLLKIDRSSKYFPDFMQRVGSQEELMTEMCSVQSV